jgi:hypothetical protein
VNHSKPLRKAPDFSTTYTIGSGESARFAATKSHFRNAPESTFFYSPQPLFHARSAEQMLEIQKSKNTVSTKCAARVRIRPIWPAQEAPFYRVRGDAAFCGVARSLTALVVQFTVSDRLWDRPSAQCEVHVFPSR